MSNLYDTPAQANFINTYVPIQFEHLYRASDTARANIEIGQQLLDKTTELQSLGSLNPIANKLWEEQIYSPIKSYIDENLSDISSLSDPRKVSKLRGLIRAAAGSPLAKTLIESKEGYKETLKSADPRWGQVYSSAIASHDPIKDGVWSVNPLPYKSWRDLSEEYTKHLQPEVIGKQGYEKVLGFRPEKILSAINANMSTISSDPSNRLLAKHEFDMAPAEIKSQYVKKSEDGSEYVDYDMFMRDQIVNSSSDKLMFRKTETDQAAISAADRAQRYAMWRERMTAQQKKDELSSVSRQWFAGASSQVANSLISDMATTVARDKRLGIQRYGQQAADAIERLNAANNKIGLLDAEKTALIGTVSKLIAAGDTKGAEAARKAISDLDRKIAVEQDAKMYHVAATKDAALNYEANIDNRIKQNPRDAEAINEKRKLIAARTVNIDAAISNIWAGEIIGEPVKFPTRAGAQMNSYRAKTTSSFRVASPSNLSTDPIIAGFGSLSNTYSKINSKLESGAFAESMLVVPQNKAIMQGGASRALAFAYVPVENLKGASIGLTDKEVAAIKARNGSVKLPPENMQYERNPDTGSYDPIAPVEYIAIPITYDFISSNMGISETLLDRAVHPKTASSFEIED